MKPFIMQNEKGQNVELYMPRRWYVFLDMGHFIATGLTESLKLRITLLLWYASGIYGFRCRLTSFVSTPRLVLLLVNTIPFLSVVTFVLR